MLFKIKTHHYFLAALIVCGTLLLFGLFPEEAMARAGGGGGFGGFSSSRGGGGSWGFNIWAFLLTPFVLIYSGITTLMLVKKNKQCKTLIDQIAAHDASWDMANIKSRVELAFFKVQEAWMKRDQEIARDFISERLYMKHKAQTDMMISQNMQNILERINLEEAKIVEVADYKDDSRDRFWAHIQGRMVDYTIDTTSGELVSGKKASSEGFAELWKFVRGPKGWVLDEIDQKVTMSDMKGFHSFSEELT